MHRARRRLVAAAALATLSRGPSVHAGQAAPDEPRASAPLPIVEDTAYTRERAHLRVGLLRLQAGVLDSLTVGTVWLPWVVKAPNLHIKWRFYLSETLAAAIHWSALTFSTRSLKSLEDKPGQARLSVTTFEPLASYTLDARRRWTLSAGLPFTAVRVDGELTDGSFHGAADGAVDNLQVTSTLQHRTSRSVALLLHARYLVVQSARASANATTQLDDYTTLEAHGQGSTSALDFPHAWSVVPSVAYVGPRFFGRIGVGYGNWSLPVVNFVLPSKTLIPELEISWFF